MRTVEAVKQELLDYGPLSVAVKAGHSGFYDTGLSGIVSCPTLAWDDIDHAVLLVGYD